MHTEGVLLFRILERLNEAMPGVGPAHGWDWWLPVFGVWKDMFIELDSVWLSDGVAKARLAHDPLAPAPALAELTWRFLHRV